MSFYRLNRSIPFLILFCIALASLSANPFLGIWKVEAIGVPEPLFMEFRDDGTYLARESMKAEPELLEYQLDENSRIIRFETKGQMVSSRFRFDGRNRFEVLLPDFLTEMLVRELDLEMEDEAEINSVTLDFIINLSEGVRELASRQVFMRGQRVQ
jgi:hypothetical protein